MDIDGDNRRNKIHGGADADHIMGFGGDDLIRAGGGGDYVDGGDGDDRLYGGDGADTLLDGGGLDLLDGGQGDDSIKAGGTDTVVGGGGDDRIEVNLTPERLTFVTDSAPSIDAGKGDDDVEVLAAANATVLGGAGDDRVIYNVSQASNPDITIGAVLDGGEGRDRFITGFDTAAGDVDLRALDGAGEFTFFNGLTVRGFESGNVAFFKDPGAIIVGDMDLDVLCIDSATSIVAGRGSSFFYNAQTIDAGAGDDTVFGTMGADTLDAGRGRDLLECRLGVLHGWTVDLLAGTAGDTFGADVISGFEDVRGSMYADRIFGDGRANRLDGDEDDTGMDSEDWLVGRGGDDVLAARCGGTSDVLTGGKGLDRFEFRGLGGAGVDIVADLEAGEVIDLSAIDADSTQAGDQSFVLVAAFDGHAGQAALSYDRDAGRTLLLLDVDGDAEAEITIALEGKHKAFDGFVL